MLPIVWLVGASGVGKSTTGWQLQQILESRGTAAAFVDADQLRNAAGISATEDELIAAGLLAIEPEFRDAGARVLIVAGIVDDDAHLARLIPTATRSRVFVVHLRASDTTLLERVEKRAWNVELAPESIDYAHQFDARWVDMELDTTHLTPAAIAAEIADYLVDLTPADERDDAASDHHFRGDGAPLTVITGAGGVGSSTTGFMVFLQRMSAGDSVGYVDSHQVGFIGANPRAVEVAGLRARNASGIVDGMVQRGVAHVILSSDPATAQELLRLHPSARVVWLDASDKTIESRLRARANGVGPPLSGDHRIGLDEEALLNAVAASVAEARDEAARPRNAVVVNTDTLAPHQVASRISA